MERRDPGRGEVADLEARLEEQAATLRMASEAARFGAWTLAVPSGEVSWSTAMHTVLDYPPDVVPSVEEGLSLYDPDSRRAVEAALEACARDGTPFDLLARMRSATGRPLWVRVIGQAERAPDGTITTVRGAFQDVTDLQEAQQETALLAIQLQRTLDSITDGVLALDQDWTVTYLNRSAEEALRVTRDELVGQNFWERFPIEQAATFHRAYQRVMHERVPVEISDYYEPLDLWAEVRAYPAEEGLVLFFRDITERRRVEEQLVQAQRLESMGTLAGGLAHDLNNLLSPILMATTMLRGVSDDPDHAGLIDTIEGAARRGADMVRQILAFAGGTRREFVPVQVRDLIEELRCIVVDTFPAAIEVHVDPVPAELAVNGDATQLHQVLLNLCLNARDAMPGGGTLRLSARSETGPSELPEVVIAVEDDGVGMDRATLDRLYHPFFTTKAPGEGTGLGLPTSRTIVRGHRGRLSVDSAPGRGSCFRVHLPFAGAAEDLDAPLGSALESSAGRQKLVLVVDDEPAVRMTIGRTLEANGYRVVLASGGSEAVHLLRRSASEVGLVVTDMTMPGMDGPATIEALRSICPDLAIVAATGFADDWRTQRDRELGVDVVLAKPFDATELLGAVERALAARASAR